MPDYFLLMLSVRATIMITTYVTGLISYIPKSRKAINRLEKVEKQVKLNNAYCLTK